ncbi:MAG: phage terminase large subunit [Planctomycetota bacterium]
MIARARAIASIRATPASLAEVLSRGQWRRTRHLQLASDLLSDLYFGDLDVDVLIFSMPPRHGKSELASHWFPVWVLDHDPTKRIGLASYEAAQASKWGRATRNTIQEHSSSLRVRISQDSTAKARWSTTVGGGMMTAGVGGPFTGEGFDWMIFDDLIKNWKQATSRLYLDSLKDWLLSTALTRLEPGGKVVVPMTRWAVDDVVGILENKEGLKVKVVSLPAIAEEADPIARQPGEALWPERYPAEKLLSMAKTVGRKINAAVFQQNPLKDKGDTFSKQHFRYWTREMNGEVVLCLHSDEGDKRIRLAACTRFSTVDLAVKPGKTNDYVVNAAWALTPAGDLVLFDRLRFKRSAPGQLKAFRQFHHRNGLAFQVIESVAFQMAMVQFMREGDHDNPPLPVREFNPGKYGNKEQRAQSAAVYQEGGKMYFPVEAQAPWLGEWEQEHTDFPGGDNDDQVDTSSMAVIEVVSGRVTAGSQRIVLGSDLLTRVSPWRD